MTVPAPEPTGPDPAAGGQDPAGGGSPDPKPAESGGGQDPQPKPGQDPGDGGLSPEAKDAELARARREAAASRKALEEANAKVKAFEDEKLSEQEKQAKAAKEADERASAAESRLQELELSNAVERAAAKAGVLDPEDATILIDKKLLEKDSEGRPTAESITTALDDLKTRKPHLFRDGQPPAPRRPGDPDGGAKPQGKTREERIREATAAGDTRTSIREKAAGLEEKLQSGT